MAKRKPTPQTYIPFQRTEPTPHEEWLHAVATMCDALDRVILLGSNAAHTPQDRRWQAVLNDVPYVLSTLETMRLKLIDIFHALPPLDEFGRITVSTEHEVQATKHGKTPQ